MRALTKAVLVQMKPRDTIKKAFGGSLYMT